MKVVLFCGGLGTRLREYSETTPKPLVPIGDRPMIWHLMKYYAHYGHTDFILCLGYQGVMIKEYFMQYKEWASNDFRMHGNGREIELFNTDLDDWRITFVDTGGTSNIGERLQVVRPFVKNEEMFLANYSDGLSDFPLEEQLRAFGDSNAMVSFAAVRPPQSFHSIRSDAQGYVTEIRDAASWDLWINGGFFIMRPGVFDYMQPGEDLVGRPFTRLASDRRLLSHTHHGFWACMDTFKDKKMFDARHENDDRPWEVWNRAPVERAARLDVVARA
ncbi:MAG: sugar phosphate nucleotidyltransferase [Halofilum sp. (in: g-proteobacteria)]